jgi:hypothetical protein
MTIKQQLLEILEKGRESEAAFIASLTDDERAEAGTFERWSAKDNLAHTSYWLELRAAQALAYARSEDFGPIPQFEQANFDVYKQYTERDWDEVSAKAKAAHAKMLEVIQGMDEDVLDGPSAESEEDKMWQALVGSAFTHRQLHFAQFYQDHDRMDDVSRLWKEWVDVVSPLDSGPDWQGGVHYNAACSLAVAGDKAAALEELKLGLALRPGLRTWSRLDSDLAVLHDDPGYKALFAPAYWWEALEADPQVEALADQWLRTLFMFRNALDTVPEEEWLKGDTRYLRPAGIALHIVQSIDLFTPLKRGDASQHPVSQINWQDRDSSNLPSKAELLDYLDVAEERLAHLLVKADLQGEEELFAWTGKTILGRTLYSLRHAQHHLADLAMELKRRGYEPPSWE